MFVAFQMTRTTIFIIKKIVQRYNWDNEKII